MKSGWYTGRAIGLSVALMLVASASAQAQDTTRARSDRRIPVRKEGGFTQRESRGEVMVAADRARIDSLEALQLTYQQRFDSITAATSSLATRTEAAERMLTALQDSLRAVRGELTTAKSELATLRGELTTTTARVNAVGDSLLFLNRRFANFRNGSMFGNSGFYVGVGTGANFTTGTLSNIGYKEGLNVAIPIGWNKLGVPIGFRGELGIQTFDGRTTSAFSNPDPEVWSAVGMVTAHLPLNQRGTNNFYLMGGGGAYMFKDMGAGSALSQRLDATTFGPSTTVTKNITKFGVLGGAGLEIHVLGATSLFVETALTNVFGEEGAIAGVRDNGKNLRWIPLVAGVQIR